MDHETAIKVDSISKKYCKSLKRSMIYGLKDISANSLGLSSNSGRLRKGEFWAVDDVSFEVKKGESLGIIGPNGSGKTTILKMLNGIFWPDKGEIMVRGTVGALIEVGAGFHPLLTGRENIYINAAILGMTKREVEEKFDSIIQFADIGDFLDSPVKHYSSGMYVRLGFAVAIHCEPDILLVDEVMAVGDREFNLRCYQKMHEIRNRGTTVVLVSHNEYTIREQTDNCLYLNNGRMRFFGKSEETISLYIRDVHESRIEESPISEIHSSTGSKKAEIVSLKFFGKDGGETTYIESGDEITIAVECLIHQNLHNPIFGVNFYDKAGFMYCANSDYEKINFGGHPLGRVRIEITIPQFHLPTNTYYCSVIIAEEKIHNLIDWHDMVYRIVVGRAKNARGSIKLPNHWKLEKLCEFID